MAACTIAQASIIALPADALPGRTDRTPTSNLMIYDNKATTAGVQPGRPELVRNYNKKGPRSINPHPLTMLRTTLSIMLRTMLRTWRHERCSSTVRSGRRAAGPWLCPLRAVAPTSAQGQLTCPRSPLAAGNPSGARGQPQRCPREGRMSARGHSLHGVFPGACPRPSKRRRVRSARGHLF